MRTKWFTYEELEYMLKAKDNFLLEIQMRWENTQNNLNNSLVWKHNEHFSPRIQRM